MLELTNIRVGLVDGIATVTISRPQAMNALNPLTISELGQVVDWIEGDNGVRAVILTGEGPKAFVAGADIAAMRHMTAEQAEIFSKAGSATLRRIELLPLPVIAAVNGFALGGGCELAMACDFIYAAEHAKFGQPEVNLGLIAGFGGTQRLPRKVSAGMAMELLLTGRIIDAAEALRIGLVNRIVSADTLLEITTATLREILSKGPVAVRKTKTLVQTAPDVTIDEGLANESAVFGDIFGTEDFLEGTGAFLEKRKPSFCGK